MSSDRGCHRCNLQERNQGGEQTRTENDDIIRRDWTRAESRVPVSLTISCSPIPVDGPTTFSPQASNSSVSKRRQQCPLYTTEAQMVAKRSERLPRCAVRRHCLPSFSLSGNAILSSDLHQTVSREFLLLSSPAKICA